MSIWVQYTVTAFGDRNAISKFFNLDPEKDIHIDQFEFSFGQKNMPGLSFDQLVLQNPDLFFLCKKQTDYDQTWFLQKFDALNNKMQIVFISSENYEFSRYTYNKLIIEEYKKQFSTIMPLHAKERPYEWAWFFSKEKIALNILNNFEMYKETEAFSTLTFVDVEMENAEPWDPDP